ncbi:MAG TPA: FAD-dependent oxidoreductase, partial [Burkholderiaceae bacterium]
VPAGLVVAPLRPVAGFGYVLPALDGRVWCGATADAGDGEPALRERNHAHNLAQLARLLGRGVDAPAAALAGRVGWRAVAADRLPWLGAVPDADALAGTRRLDQPRLVPRTPGLFALTALGSRGIPTALLGARTVAASIAGTPCPLEASLLDAVDAARFVARAMRLSRS